MKLSKTLKNPVTLLPATGPFILLTFANSPASNPLSKLWWRWTGSNRRHLACKASALPAELHPHSGPVFALADLVGLGRFELPTSRLSGVRSNQLSYRPAVLSLFLKIKGLTPQNRITKLPYLMPCETLVSTLRLFSECFSFCHMSPFAPSPMWPWKEALWLFCLRKEVIQPLLPQRLPCYDFTPITAHTLVRCLPKVGPRTSGTNDSHGVTGGVYKARERIHRGMLIRDY